MIRSVRVLAIATFVAIVLTKPAHAIAGPELDPGWMAAGLTILAAGGMYLVERFRSRR